MTVRPEVVKYLRVHVSQYTDEALRDRLIRDGVSAGEVDGAFAIINLARPPSHITDRGRAPIANKNPKRRSVPWLRKLLIFGAGAVFFGAIIGTQLLVRKLNTPEMRLWLNDLQGQAAALTAPANRRAAATGPKSALTREATDGAFATYSQLAYRALAGKKNKDAIRYADLALEGWSANLHGMQNKKTLLALRARAYEETGQKSRALDDYQSIAKANPNDIDSRISRGRIFLDQSSFRAAVREAEAVISLAPDKVEGYTLAAAAYARMGRKRLALQNFSKAIDTLKASGPEAGNNAMLANLHFNRGVLLANDSKGRLAVKDFSYAIGLSPKNPLYYGARAQTYRTLGKNRLASKDDLRVRELAATARPDAGPPLGLGSTLPRRVPATLTKTPYAP